MIVDIFPSYRRYGSPRPFSFTPRQINANYTTSVKKIQAPPVKLSILQQLAWSAVGPVPIGQKDVATNTESILTKDACVQISKRSTLENSTSPFVLNTPQEKGTNTIVVTTNSQGTSCVDLFLKYNTTTQTDPYADTVANLLNGTFGDIETQFPEFRPIRRNQSHQRFHSFPILKTSRFSKLTHSSIIPSFRIQNSIVAQPQTETGTQLLSPDTATNSLICHTTHTTISRLTHSSIKFQHNPETTHVEVLGRGTTATVFLGTLKSEINNIKVAVKIYNQENSFIESALYEASILKILEYTGFCPKIFGLIPRSSEGQPLAMVQEAIANSVTLHKLIVEMPLFMDRTRWINIAFQLAYGLKLIHEKGVLINDLKSDNILVDCTSAECRIKFIDMGHATYKTGKLYNISEEEAHIYNHLGPEFRNGGYSTTASDIFSLGGIFKCIPVPEIQHLSTDLRIANHKFRPPIEQIISFIEDNLMSY